MEKLLRKNKKYLGLVLIAAIAFNFLFLPLIALAQPLPTGETTDPASAGALTSWVVGKILLFASDAVSMFFSAVFGLVLSIEAQIIDYILSPTNFSFTNSPIVTLGWGITRDLANMFFILILLIIAFATVLKIQSYAIKQLWWKVLVAALLINFSLVIAGFVIDFTQVLTTFFIKQAIGDGAISITTKLANSMKITNFYNPAPSTSAIGGITQLGGTAIAAFVGIILTLVGLVVTVFVFGAAAIFLIVRILYIWFLLIIAPIAWMLWILPATSGQFSKWWDTFLKWAFFAPIYVFFIYLSLSIFDATGKLKPETFWETSNPSWNTAAPGLTTVGMPAALFQWILVIAMMFGSLIVAQKLGVEGAAGARKIITGWGDKSKNWAGRQLRGQALGVGAKEAAPGVKARPGLLVRGAQKLAAIPGGRLFADQVFKMTTAEAGTVEDAKKQFAKWTPEANQAYVQAGRGTTNQQMGAALALKEQGKLDKLDPDEVKAEARIRELVSLASRYSPENVDKLLEVAPHMATEFNKKIKEVVAKIEKANQIMLSSLANSEVIFNLSPNQLKDIVQKADTSKVEKIKVAVDYEIGLLEKSPDPNEKALAKEIKDIAITFKKEERNKKLKALTEKNELAGKIARTKFITSSPAWEI
ncbi:MAG: hypothetical protein Q8N43_02985 [Candidatus Azambacteria bacterium]|nr:hypothetical protein [Candidatus Azambacteria bacterium]